MRVGLVADDLTGACDSAAPFLAGGRVVVGLWPCVPDGDLACAAVSTESREGGERDAFERSREAARRLAAAERLYRKVDSMLRGHLRADLEGTLAARPGPCLLAPALPAEGRTTRGGVQRWPGGEANVAALLGQELAARVRVADAESDADLRRLAAEVAANAELLPAGSAGLAAQLPAALGMGGRPRAAVRAVRPLALVGSPAAARQAAFARERGWAVRCLGPGDGPGSLRGHDALLLTGGETAARVLSANGATGLELLGEALPRVPVARVLGGRLAGLPVVLKAGAFGGEDAIDAALSALRDA